jgi:hypothetical protein
VSIHYNNWSCNAALAPFPAWAYQVLWVNKRLAEVDTTAAPKQPGAPPDAPDNAHGRDCQSAP